MNTGDKIKKKRKELGLTRLDIANKIGISEAMVRSWENGDMTNLQQKILELASILGVSPAYLMGWENESISENTSVRRLLAMLKMLDEDARRELLGYAEDKTKAYEKNPHLKNAENIAQKHIDKKRTQSDKNNKS